MAPSDPVRLSILKNVQATLQGMLDVLVYHYPVQANEHVGLDPAVNILIRGGSEGVFYIVEPTPDGTKEFYESEQIVENFLLSITGRYDVSSDDPLAKVTAWENMAADLEVALEADMTRGGYACDTRCGTPQPFVGTGSNVVILVQPVSIKLYRRYGTP